MKNPFRPGDIQVYETTVTDAKLARFEGETVHPVYATFALGQDAEWACRQFVLAMREPEEEGIGTYLSVEHLAPAPLGAAVRIEAELIAVSGTEVHCRYRAYSGERLLARGEQRQRVIPRTRLAAHFLASG